METEMSLSEILATVFIVAATVVVVSFFYKYMSQIPLNIEENALRRSATEISENLLHGDMTENDAFVLEKLNELDNSLAEPVKHCYAYNVVIVSSKKIDDKNMWKFGYSGDEKDFKEEIPTLIKAGGELIPAKFSITVFDTNRKRCK